MDMYRSIDESKARLDQFRREAAEFRLVRQARQRRRAVQHPSLGRRA